MIAIHHVSLDNQKEIVELMKKKYSFRTVQQAEQAFLDEYNQGHHFRAAWDGGKIVGLISWRPQGETYHGVAELTRLAVLSDYHDPRAVKELMFDVMIAEADDFYHSHGSHLRKIFSMIHADARHVREFFVDKGLQQEAVLKNHFHPNKDELVFSMFLS